MRSAATAYTVFQGFVLVYFVVLNLAYAMFVYLGLKSVIIASREMSETTLQDLLERGSYKPVSILVPAYNEERSIVESVRALLGLHHPEYEVVVIADGPTDRTLDLMIEAFALTEVPEIYRVIIPTMTVKRVFRSTRHPNLVVAEKVNGGKADALNVGLNLARYPIVCAVDADSLLDARALLRAYRIFTEDETVVAVGGTVRPLNGAVVKDGRIVDLQMPRGWLERFQALEYARAFFTGRAAWSRFGALVIISGAFGLFRRDAAIKVGGYRTSTVGEDMELVARLHRHFRDRGEPYKVVFAPDPVCWTEVPSDLRTLRRQRNRWQRGLWETLWIHRGMMLRPRYGRVGMLGMPYFWIFEGLSPIVEMLGLLSLPVAWALGVLSMRFVVLFFILAVLFGTLLSELAAGIETLLLTRYHRLRDRLILLGAAFLESLGYRQILSFERFIATFQVLRKRGHWGPMTRAGIGAGAPAPAEPSAPPEPPCILQSTGA